MSSTAAQTAPTPHAAGASAKKAGAGAKKGSTPAKVKRPAAKYRCAATGQTWSGKCLQPKWLKVALEGGKTLADFLASPEGTAPKQKVTVEAGCAGPARDPNTADLFAVAGA